MSITRRAKLKLDVFSRYSNGTPKCAECGELNLDFLVLDHINNDSEEHMKANNYSRGTQTWIWARTHNFPPIFQVLCYRHNNRKTTQWLKNRIIQLETERKSAEAEIKKLHYLWEKDRKHNAEEIQLAKEEVELWKKNRNIYVEKKNKLYKKIENAQKILDLLPALVTIRDHKENEYQINVYPKNDIDKLWELLRFTLSSEPSQKEASP